MKKIIFTILLCVTSWAFATEQIISQQCMPLCNENWKNEVYTGEVCNGAYDYIPQVDLIVDKVCVHNNNSVSWLTFFCDTKEHNYYDYSVAFCKKYAVLDSESLIKAEKKLGPLGVLKADPCVKQCVSEYAYKNCEDF